MAESILGISAFYHDSAAAIIVDGQLVAAAQEERFSREKHDSSFPGNAVKYVLDEAGIPLEQITSIVFYEKPFLKFERLLETYHAFAPRGIESFVTAMPVWLKDKLFMRRLLKRELGGLGKVNSPIWFPEHHLSHAASAFYPSPFDEAAILTVDGVGEWATSTIGIGRHNQIELLKELHFPHSLGLLYSAFTYYTGFRVNSGEYKLMGLAPYGSNDSKQTQEFRNKILRYLVDIHEDGSIRLNMDYFGFATGLRMTRNRKWKDLFGMPPRDPEREITQDYMNMALAIQQVTEEIVYKMACHAREITKCRYLTFSGGVALNCVANGKLHRSGIFDDIWIQPAAGDAGGAVGAALAGWHIGLQRKRIIEKPDGMKASLLGPEYTEKEILKTLTRFQANAIHYDDFNLLCHETASLLNAGNVIGWFQGRMEFGPRALGNRSILGDARNPDMQKRLNLKIKYREGFRPFAPAVVQEKTREYFDLHVESPYMLLVAPVQNARCYKQGSGAHNDTIWGRLYQSRSDIPAVTHIDWSARVQTVSRKANTRFYQLLQEFSAQTGCDVLVNTSFNVRGEPIVCTPDDAYRCFMSTEMDYLVMGNFLLSKKDQSGHINFTKGAKGRD
jgi:carbamoyltransferase